MSFFENTRKPVGLGGKIMVAMIHHNFSNLYKLSGLKIKLLHKHFACYIIDTGKSFILCENVS